MNLVNGVDLIEIERIASVLARHGSRFLERVYTPGEIKDCKMNPASLAARFAAKEAVAKALGCGIGAVAWQEIEIRRDPAGRPLLHLHGAAAALAADLSLTGWSISLTHTNDYALAFVVAIAP